MAKFHYVDKEDLSRDPFAAEERGSDEFEALLSGETVNVQTRRYRQGEQVTGRVMSVGEEFLFIELGGKNAGALAIEEYKGGDALMPKLGDDVTVYVREDNGSEVILTRQLRRGETDDTALRSAYENKVPVEAKIEKVTKGGFEASLSGKRAFVPQSQIDTVPVENPEAYVGQVFKFHITEFKGGKNIVLSRKSILREEQQETVQALLRTLSVGQVLRATVTRLADFGAFADLGGVEGLIPLSELSWKRVKKAEEVVKPGEQVNVKILRIEHAPRLRIALSLKDAGEDPWVANATRLTPGEVLEGTVVRLADFGAFVSVFEGVEGLAHVSQLTWEKRVAHPREMVKEGQAVKVHVLSFDLEGHKLSLSVKGPMPEELAKKFAARKAGGGQADMSPEEREQMTEWESFQKIRKENPSAGQSAGLFADAFARANKKKK
ncbi:MAG: S1 RNA-binding domain-containing protein [Silvanigrellales bacterium]|nr:S1 RNA-binding domain-containing protein [Silvanigrellales bacterium]